MQNTILNSNFLKTANLNNMRVVEVCRKCQAIKLSHMYYRDPLGNKFGKISWVQFLSIQKDIDYVRSPRPSQHELYQCVYLQFAIFIINLVYVGDVIIDFVHFSLAVSQPFFYVILVVAVESYDAFCESKEKKHF